MASGMPFIEWCLKYPPPNKRSEDSRQLHEFEAWHCPKANNGASVTKKKTTHDPGTCYPYYSIPVGQGREELWEDAMRTILEPLLPLIEASRAMLPPGCRPRVLQDGDGGVGCFGVRGTGCSYLGLNITPSADWGFDAFSFAGTCDDDGGHFGIHVHHDANNAQHKLGLVAVLGTFEGFEQLLVPFGLGIKTTNGGLLWVDDSRMLHGVRARKHTYTSALTR